MRLRDRDLTTIVLSNLYLFPFDQVSRGLLRLALDKPLEPPALTATTALQMTACAGRYVGADGRPMQIEAGPHWASPRDDCLCDPADPEVEFRFSKRRGGRYQRVDYISPLWPAATSWRAD